MAKIKEDDLQRLKRIQDIDDDDLGLDITKSRKMLISTAKKLQHESKSHESGKRPEQKRHETKAEDKSRENEQKDTKTLLIMLGGLVGIIVIFLLLALLKPGQNHPLTIDELHQANLQGMLDPEDGYIYNGFSFIKFDNIWYSQLAKNNTVYDVTFNNGPKDVEDIPVEGQLSSRFNQGRNIYITFDPYTKSTKYITVANAGLSMSLVKGFNYNLTAGCTDPESPTCQKTQVITCDDKDKAVIYFKEANETKIILEDNCVTIQGFGPEIVRAKDRLLMRWYGMMD